MLRHKMLAINNSWLGYKVAKIIPQDIHDGLVGPALVMALQVLDVFKQEGSRLLGLYNLRNFIKQGTLSLALKAMRPSQRVLFRP